MLKLAPRLGEGTSSLVDPHIAVYFVLLRNRRAGGDDTVDLVLKRFPHELFKQVEEKEKNKEWFQAMNDVEEELERMIRNSPGRDPMDVEAHGFGTPRSFSFLSSLFSPTDGVSFSFLYYKQD